MTWSDFYLFCFIVGFSLSVLSFLAGAIRIHLPFKMHLPFHLGHHVGGAHGGMRGSFRASVHFSWLNASTAMAFLAWFGGTGYLLTRHSHLVALRLPADQALSSRGLDISRHFHLRRFIRGLAGFQIHGETHANDGCTAEQ